MISWVMIQALTMTTQTTVQVAWVETALNAIEIATKPDPVKKIMNKG